MVIKKIIVHPKTFHSDEIVAIAVMRILFPEIRSVPVLRKYPTSHELKNPDTLVIDCGGEYIPQRNNFDHHQNQDLPCACRLIWQHFAPEKTKEEQMLKRGMDILFFRSIDRHDRGICFAGGNAIGTAISAMNYLPDGFESALGYAELTLKALIARQKEIIPIRNFWKSGSSFGGSSRLRFFSQRLVESIKDSFFEYAASTKKTLLIIWQSDDDRYVLRSMSQKYTIPRDKRQIEFHGLHAIYTKKEDVLNHALELAAQHFRKKEYNKHKAV